MQGVTNARKLSCSLWKATVQTGPIAGAEVFGCTKEQAEGRARLIAVAPYMAEALIDILWCQSRNIFDKRLAEACDKGRAALDRASIR